MLRSKNLMYLVILGFFVYRDRKIKYGGFGNLLKPFLLYMMFTSERSDKLGIQI
ncbi:hypothetical protein PPSQR21_012550 [Paenibacillus polymyxa SQR-21]|nr:hypothetical protein PPSQR21_012550 [Paenibacillus polymyxa SQR-21]